MAEEFVALFCPNCGVTLNDNEDYSLRVDDDGGLVTRELIEGGLRRQAETADLARLLGELDDA